MKNARTENSLAANSRSGKQAAFAENAMESISNRKEDKKKVSVTDLRRDQMKAQQKNQPAINSSEQAVKSTEQDRKGETSRGGGDSLSFELLKSQTGKKDAASSKHVEAQRSFASELDDALKSHIVKQAAIILRGDSAGEIRLTLKPDHLGKVRVKLELEDKNIIGKIFVENETVRNVFQQNMGSLQKAFADGGLTLEALM